MSKWIMTLVATTVFVLMGSVAWAQSEGLSQRAVAGVGQGQQVSCRYLSGDVGTVIGQGANIHEARAEASRHCFQRRADLYERLRGPLDEERGLDIIDSCVNIRCG